MIPRRSTRSPWHRCAARGSWRQGCRDHADRRLSYGDSGCSSPCRASGSMAMTGAAAYSSAATSLTRRPVAGRSVLSWRIRWAALAGCRATSTGRRCWSPGRRHHRFVCQTSTRSAWAAPSRRVGIAPAANNQTRRTFTVSRVDAHQISVVGARGTSPIAILRDRAAASRPGAQDVGKLMLKFGDRPQSPRRKVSWSSACLLTAGPFSIATIHWSGECGVVPGRGCCRGPLASNSAKGCGVPD